MRKAILLALLPLLIVACSGKTTKKADNPGVIYVEGVELMKKKKWDQAIAKFSQVRENFPFDPMADIATVKLGDVYFEQEEYLLAVGVYTDFVNSHPDDENAPYVLWRLGESFERLSLTIDRDQVYTLKAVERLTYLVNRYPTNQYALEAKEPLRRLTQKLADRELYVGDWYYRTGSYNAATMRLEYFLTKYPGAPGTDKALHTLSAAYRQLADTEKAQYYFERLTKEYPNSSFLKSQTKGGGTSKVVRADQPPPPQQTQARPFALGGLPASNEEATAPVGSRTGHSGKVTYNGQEIAPHADRIDKVSTLSWAEEDRNPRQIELRPAGRETNPPKGKEQTAGALQKVAESEKGKESADKPEGKSNVFGFFSSKKPVDIVADAMEGLEKGRIIIFKGHVVTKQDDMQIFSDTLTAYLNEQSNEVERADASGNVKIVKAERTATCDQALFENTKGEITLKGNVVVYSGPDRLAGDTVVYYINEDRVTVVGEKEKRARITVQPK